MSLTTSSSSSCCNYTFNPLLSSKPFRPPHFRVFRRPRFKPNPLACSFPPNPQSSPSPFHFITPALAFSSAAALYFSRLISPNKPPPSPHVGDWILFSTPTPFNRFVLLRCPTLSFQDDANDKLLTDDRHYVTINSGTIQVTDSQCQENDECLTYQRVCVTTEDGGVVSLDWPSNLDLEEERGLDSTLLLVPGTTEGSNDSNIRTFVLQSLKRGFFPVVMNPRGCARSPLTTPRLFTAADSDDICMAINYINKARPWTTLMGVGLGYGANMLTKYLAEVGERTPLTAATCIDNPFDLDEATRTSPYHDVSDQKLTSGLKDILQTNKALFQGKTKNFDVERALLAKSVRDFDEAISMVSYGFGAIQDFYSKSSSRDVIRDLKIPVLFIQSDNGMVPAFSVPRDLIAENPYTSLLLCSCLPSSVIDTDRSAMSWCQLLTIEWLTAVELGLLKGRHPLLTDIDVTVNPSKGLAVVEETRSNKNDKVRKLLDLTRSDAFNGYLVGPTQDFLEESNTDAKLNVMSKQDIQSNLHHEDMSLQVKNSPLQETSSADAELIEVGNVGSIDGENGQVLQTAQVVINMLDVTMPGTLTEEKKRKVLTAVGQGETLMKALQDAVPEDVRGKLTDSVTAIMHAHGSDLKFDKVLHIPQASEALSGKKSQEKSRVSSGTEGALADQSSLNQMKKTSSVGGSDNASSGMGKAPGKTETEVLPLEKSSNSENLIQSQESGSEVGSSGSSRKETSESRDNNGTKEELREKSTSDIDHSEKGSETGAKPYTPSQPAEIVCIEAEASAEQKNLNSEIARTDLKDESNFQKVEQKSQDLSGDQSKMTITDAKDPSSPPMPSEHQTTEGESGQSKMTLTDAKDLSSPPMPSEHQTTEGEGNDNEKKDNKNTQHISHQTKSTSSDSGSAGFSVSQALDALTGMDDSTQVAVNSVFGVIENMLSQLEQSSDNKCEDKDGKDVEHELGEKKHSDSQSMDSNTSDGSSGKNHYNAMCLESGSCDEGQQLTHSLNTTNKSRVFNSEDCHSENCIVQKGTNMSSQLADQRFLSHKWDGEKPVNRMPQNIAMGLHGDSLYNEYLRKCLVSKIPSKSLDLDTTTALFLDYFPAEGQWKLFDQPQNMENAASYTATSEEAVLKMKAHSSAKSSDAQQYIEPSYVILDTDKKQEPVEEFISTDTMNEVIDKSEQSDELIQFVKKRVLDALKIEVGRKLNLSEINEMKLTLAVDLEHVANEISLAVAHSKVQLYTEGQVHIVQGGAEKIATLDGEHIIRVISSSVQETGYLRRVMPVGVIVGSILAALREYFNVTTLQDNGQRGSHSDDNEGKPAKKNYGNVTVTEIDQVTLEKSSLENPTKREEAESRSEHSSKNTVMVGAVTAALGASALLMQQEDPQQGGGTAERSSLPLKMNDQHQKGSKQLVEEISEKNQNNLVTSLAEKAMSVAAPVVPTKEDGGVDQERLISFLRIAERPLFQRIFGFVGMILVLWSPVAIPLLPTLVQSWTTQTPSRFAQFACIVGLYTSTMILIMLWGKRIRGYENAFKQYGLDLKSSHQIFELLKGFFGGIILVFSIHAVNAFLGWATFSWPCSPSSLDAMTWFKVYGRMLLVVVQGTVMASGIALVEELLFRSWLPQEIAVDLGYFRGVMISGLVFSLLQRSLLAVPGLWLLSLSLSGARQRNGGSLSVPIGIRTGIITSTFFLQKGGLLRYSSTGNFPLWVTGTHPFQPFSGLVGLAFSFSLAILLYPRHTQKREAHE
ncbi:hypothetical protein PIB30_011543 [Stylosanthes scabra]|uniref:Embryogenesis-associated protein EMB8 n=1 Tax=Stylosanthes scabra TaxID=79078 RepID=A0ABU6U4Q0_9FABA|nr:hypothetical protein [Stylosanthes scabra]